MSLDEWIENDMKFRFGKWYNDIINKNKKNIPMENPGFIPEQRLNNNEYDYELYGNLFEKCYFNYHDSQIKTHRKNTYISHNREKTDDELILGVLKNFTDYNICNYNKNIDINYEDKISKCIFRGSSTGYTDNNKNKNKRILYSKKYNNNNNFIDIGINNFCQGHLYDELIYKPGLSKKELLKYKYILALEGNDVATAIPWILNSNSLLLKDPSRYYNVIVNDKLIPYIHYIPVNIDDLEEKIEWCENHTEQCKEIIKNANKFIEPYTSKDIYIKKEKRFVSLLNECFY